MDFPDLFLDVLKEVLKLLFLLNAVSGFPPLIRHTSKV